MSNKYISVYLDKLSDCAFIFALGLLLIALTLFSTELIFNRINCFFNKKINFISNKDYIDSNLNTTNIFKKSSGKVYNKIFVWSNKTKMLLIYFSIVSMFVCIVLRGIATFRMPWGNMYEFINLTSFFTMFSASLTLKNLHNNIIWIFIVVPVILLLIVSKYWLYSTAAPVMPALQSYWLLIHVSIISLSCGLFLTSGISSILLILKIYPIKKFKNILVKIINFLPSSKILDNVSYTTAKLAFIAFSFGIAFGAIWAEVAWGRYWGWDPKETMSFVSWIIYAAYLHSRSTIGWQKSKQAWINIIGLITILFNLFFINLVIAGLHSYAGIL